ncbi:MAG TPA: arylamine N-acetyltransferase [Candidatus Limnocylindrales bacterium]|nr:arylamine N-acetyltransferase [Candidatus Limnocylindrales bacterium]
MTMIDAYLERIGAGRESTLAELQHRHLLTVPFENLSIHLGEEIELEADSLVRKVVERRRGGFCYELNGAFATLLMGLGHHVELLQARVLTDGGVGIPYDHMALRVDGEFLADVGYGAFSHYPLRIGDRRDQADPAGTFRITETGEGDLDVFFNGEPEYRLELRPRMLPDFRAGCWWHRTSPRSHFTRQVICSRLTGQGRISLSGSRTLTTTALDGAKTTEPLDGDDAMLAAFRKHFSIELTEVPSVRAVE